MSKTFKASFSKLSRRTAAAVTLIESFYYFHLVGVVFGSPADREGLGSILRSSDNGFYSGISQ